MACEGFPGRYLPQILLPGNRRFLQINQHSPTLIVICNINHVSFFDRLHLILAMLLLMIRHPICLTDPPTLRPPIIQRLNPFSQCITLANYGGNDRPTRNISLFDRRFVLVLMSGLFVFSGAGVDFGNVGDGVLRQHFLVLSV